jgi:hypothetical protein
LMPYWKSVEIFSCLFLALSTCDDLAEPFWHLMLCHECWLACVNSLNPMWLVWLGVNEGRECYISNIMEGESCCLVLVLLYLHR